MRNVKSFASAASGYAYHWLSVFYTPHGCRFSPCLPFGPSPVETSVASVMELRGVKWTSCVKRAKMDGMRVCEEDCRAQVDGKSSCHQAYNYCDPGAQLKLGKMWKRPKIVSTGLWARSSLFLWHEWYFIVTLGAKLPFFWSWKPSAVLRGNSFLPSPNQVWHYSNLAHLRWNVKWIIRLAFSSGLCWTWSLGSFLSVLLSHQQVQLSSERDSFHWAYSISCPTMIHLSFSLNGKARRNKARVENVTLICHRDFNEQSINTFDC